MSATPRRRSGLLVAGAWLLGLAGLAAIVTRERADQDPPPSPTVRTSPRDRAPKTVRRSETPLRPRRPRAIADAFRQDLRNTGRSAVRGPSEGRIRCRAKTGGRITAQPVFDARGHIVVGSEDGRVHLFDRHCAVLREVPLDGPVDATALIAPGGTVYVGTRRGTLYRLDRDLAVRGRTPLGAAIEAAPTRAPDGTVYVAAGRELVALTPEGAVVFRFHADDTIATTPALDDDGTLYVGTRDGHLYALDREGRVRWSFRAGGDIDSTPLLSDRGSVVFGSDDGRLYALDRDGVLRWAVPLGGYVRAAPALGPDGTVVAATYGPRPRVVAVEEETGELRWDHSLTPTRSRDVGIASSPIVDVDGAVYVGAHDDYLYALSPDGQLRWVFRAGADIDGPPALSPDGAVVVGSDDRRLYVVGEVRPEAR